MAIITPHLALRILIVRAIWLFVLITPILEILKINSSIGAVLLVTALGFIDIQRRHESVLWTNLGYGAWQTTGVFALVAIALQALYLLAALPLVRVLVVHAR